MYETIGVDLIEAARSLLPGHVDLHLLLDGGEEHTGDGGDGFHEWQGTEKDNALTPWGDERVSIELCCRPGSSYDLFVYDQETAKEVGHSLARDRTDKGIAIVRFQPEGRHGYRVRVRLAEGKGGPFHLSSLSAGLSCSTIQGTQTTAPSPRKRRVMAVPRAPVPPVTRTTRSTRYSAAAGASMMLERWISS